MPFLQRPDANLYYEVTGSGPALIFAHGLGGNHLSWWQQVPYFRDRYTCVTFAHRGFAPSRQTPSSPGADAYTDDLEALIDHLQLPDVRLVAQSMGGWTCLDYTARYPDRVRALVMAATIGTLNHSDTNRLLATADPAISQALFARGIHPAAGERMAHEQPALHYLYCEINSLSYDLDKEMLRRKLLATRTLPAATVAALNVPVLCITGEEDVVVPPSAVAAMADLIPGARLVRVPNTGHSVYFERPSLFNQLVDGFLRATDGR